MECGLPYPRMVYSVRGKCGSLPNSSMHLPHPIDFSWSSREIVFYLSSPFGQSAMLISKVVGEVKKDDDDDDENRTTKNIHIAWNPQSAGLSPNF